MTTSRAGPGVARRVLAVALAVVMSGCSFVSVQRPRAPAAVDDPRLPDACTTTSVAPVADTVLAAAGLVAGYVAMLVSLVESADCTASTCDSGTPDVASIALFGAGALYTGSAVYGYVSTAQCRRRLRAGEWCAGGDLGACQRLKPGWAPPPGWRPGPTFAPGPTAAPAATLAPTPAEWPQEPALPEPAPPPSDASER